MPFTYLAHQAPALALKRRWPRSFDGVALALGTMAPDWAYALAGSRLAFDAHSALGVVLFCTPARQRRSSGSASAWRAGWPRRQPGNKRAEMCSLSSGVSGRRTSGEL